jgi:predicted ATPase
MLRRVRIRNFKSFRDATFPLGNFSLVVGANGTGKSNLFDALRFLKFIGMGTSIRDAIEGHVSATPSDFTVPGIRGGSQALTHFASKSKVFDITVDVKSASDELRYSISVDAINYRVVNEELVSKNHPGSYVFSTHPDINPLAQDAESPVIWARFYKNTRGPNPRRSFSSRESVLSQFRERRAESNVNEQIARRLRAELSSIRPLELRPEILRQYAPLGSFELGEHGENLAAAAWLLRTRVASDDEAFRGDARERLAAIQDWLSELTPHEIQEVNVQQAPTGEVIFAVREQPFSDLISARSLSDGTLCFAALTFAVLGTSTRQTLLVEELENGIHPARLSVLVNMLEEVTKSAADIQVIATTHAPGILDYASRETISNSMVIGWDAENNCSAVVPIGQLPDLERIREDAGLGQLQSEGWLQLAADQ